MIDLYDHAVEKVYECVPGPKDKHANAVNFRCPYCGDSKKSKYKKRGWLYRNPEGISYHCFNCQKNSYGYQFISDITGLSVKEVMKEVLEEHKHMSGQSLMKHVLDTETPSASASIRESEKTEVQEVREVPEVRLKSTWVDLTKNEEAVMLIIERMIDQAPFLPDNFELYYDTESKRIVIPWYHHRKLVYWQMRKVYGNSDRKYLFPMKTEIPHKALFGLDGISDDCQYVFYTEGVFDAIFIKNCIAVGGLVITEYQQGLLEPYLFDKQLVLFPDNPWLDTASKGNLVKLAEDCPDLLMYMWPKDCPYKDVNEMVIAMNDPNIFTDLSTFEHRIFPAIKCKMMLMFGRDNV